MATLRGGLRDRMVLESVLQAVVADLTTQGWFDATVYDSTPGTRQHRPITVVDEYPDDNAEVELNTLAFSFSEATGIDGEMGSKLEVHRMDIFVDFFAESDAIGRHVIGDIYAYLKEQRVLSVYDYRQATPPVEFDVDIEDDVAKRKPTRAVNPWQKHWHVVSMTVTDDRAN
jgi:hypothetical protein